MKREVKLLKKLNKLIKGINCRGYLHHFGPKKYKLIQHLFALLFMEIARLSFRRAVKLMDLLGFITPTYSALCKSRKRIPLSLWNSLMKLTAGMNHEEVAIDSTGISKVNASFHYMRRIDRETPTRDYIKQSCLFDVKNKTFIAIRIRSKPRHDIMDAEYLLKRADIQKTLLGDTAYDAEWLHEYCFEKGIQTQIKPRKNVKRGFYRRKQMKNYSDEKYHQRSLIESGFGSLKRKYGGFTLAKNWKSIRNEAYLKAVAHNLRLSSVEIFN